MKKIYLIAPIDYNNFISLYETGLTNRHIDVLSCKIFRKQNSQIALALRIATKTVEEHIDILRTKIAQNTEFKSLSQFIDYLEYSEYYYPLKLHYINLLIMSSFEKKILNLFRSKGSKNCLLNYQDDTNRYLKQTLKKHLKLANIQILNNDQAPNYDITCIINVFHENTKVTSKQSNVNEITLILSDQTAIDSNTNKYQHNEYYDSLFALLSIIYPDVSLTKAQTQLHKEAEGYKRNFQVKGQLTTNPPKKLPYIKYQKKVIGFLSVLLVCIISLLGYYSLNNNVIKNHGVITKIAQRKANQIFAFNLPLRNKNFVGRETSIKMIKQNLTKNNIDILTQTITGAGGIGKTQLATEYAYRAIKEKFYDAILWVAAETDNAINSSYYEFAKKLNINIESLKPEEVVNIIHSELIHKHNVKNILFIFDNVPIEKDIQINIQELHKKFPVENQPHVLITSRSQHWRSGTLSLDLFTNNEAKEYVKKYLPYESEKAISKLIQRLGNYPLALSHAVSYIRQHTNIEDYLKLINSKQENLDLEPDNLNGYKEKLWEVLSIILRKISKPAKEILYISCYLNPDNIQLELFDDIPLKTKNNAIQELREHSVITINRDGKSFKIHRLPQEIIKSTIKNEYKWFNQVLHVLENKFVFNYSKNAEWEEYYKYFLHVNKIVEASSEQEMAKFIQLLKLYISATMFQTYVQWTPSTINSWLKIENVIKKYYAKDSNQYLIANIYTKIGIAFHIMAKYSQAKDWVNKALLIYQNTKIKDINNSDIIKKFFIASAATQYARERNLPEMIDYEYSYALMQFGVINRALGNYEEANKSYKMSLEIINKYDNNNDSQYYKAEILSNLGILQIYTGELVASEKYLILAKNMSDQIYVNHPQQTYVHQAYATLLYQLGDFEKANKLINDTLKSRKKIFPDDHREIGHALLLKGAINLSIVNNTIQAENDLKLAEKILYKNYKKCLYYRCLFLYQALVRFYESKMEYDNALVYLKKIYDFPKEYPFKIATTSMFSQLTQAENWRFSSKVQNLDYLKKALNFYSSLYNEESYHMARYHYLLGIALENNGQFQLAASNYELSVKILGKQKIPHPNLAKYYQQNIKLAQHRLEKLKQISHG